MGNMEKRIKNLMDNMSGRDLGRLFMKDEIAALGGDSRVYSAEDFDAVFKKLDWPNRNEYTRYRNLLSHISTRMLYGWWLCNVIEKVTLKFDCILCITRLFHAFKMASLSLTFQRLSYGTPEGDWRDPGEDEILLRDLSEQLKGSVPETREGIEELHNTLMAFAKEFLTFDAKMKALAEMLDMPEIASIVESPIHYVEKLKQDIESELATLPPNSPYRELLPEIDVSSLEPDTAEVENYISDTAKFLKA